MLAGAFLAFMTSVSWAFGNVFVQKSGKAVGAPRAMLWALGAGGTLCAACALLFDHRVEPFTVATAAWIAIGGAGGIVAYACLFYSLEHAPLSTAVPLISSWALVSGVLSLAVFGEKASVAQLAGAGCVLAGVVLVSVGGSRPDPAGGAGTGPVLTPRALWASLGSGFGFGIMIPAMAHVTPASGEFGASAAVYGIGILLALPLAHALKLNLRPPPRALWGLVLVTGLFETLGFLTFNFARRFAPVAVVSPVASLASTLTVLYAWIFLRERPGFFAGTGAFLASAGLVILSL